MSGVFNIIGNAKSAVLSAISTALSAIQTAIEIIDDWDQNDRAKTSPIPSQDGVAAGSGATDALTQRVVSATDDPGVVSLGVMDDWDSTDDSAAPSDGASLNLTAKSAQKTAVDDGDAVKGVANLHGEQVVAGHTWATTSNRIEEINPNRQAVDFVSLVDQSDLGIGSRNYPSDNGFEVKPHKDFSLTGRMNDPDGTMTLTIEATNDDDLVTGIWHDITISGYRPDLNQTDFTSITVTNGSIDFAFDFDGVNYDRLRVKVVNDGATNAISLKSRWKA
jgi:hypothetical protein